MYEQTKGGKMGNVLVWGVWFCIDGGDAYLLMFFFSNNLLWLARVRKLWESTLCTGKDVTSRNQWVNHPSNYIQLHQHLHLSSRTTALTTSHKKERERKKERNNTHFLPQKDKRHAINRRPLPARTMPLLYNRRCISLSPCLFSHARIEQS